MSLFFFHFQPDLKLKLMLDQHGHFGNNRPVLIFALMKELTKTLSLKHPDIMSRIFIVVTNENAGTSRDGC